MSGTSVISRLSFFRGLFCAASLALFSVPSHASSEEAVSVSSAPAQKQPADIPLMLTIEKDRRESRVQLDYSVRWDFSDLAGFRPGLMTFVRGVTALGNWDITENTRVKYYGFRTNPWRLFIARERTQTAQAPGNASAITSSGNGGTAYRKKVRVSFSPLIDDLKEGIDDNLRKTLLQNSLKAAGPQWTRLSTKDKKSFFQGRAFAGYLGPAGTRYHQGRPEVYFQISGKAALPAGVRGKL